MNIFIVNIASYDHDMIKLMHFRADHWSWSSIYMFISILTVLSILTAVSSLTVVYPKVVLTMVFIPTVVYILTVVSSLSDYSPQHNPHSYFHVIFISAYPAVRVNFYAYAQWFNNKLTYYLLETKAVCKPATIDITTRREETNAGTTQMTALVKGCTC